MEESLIARTWHRRVPTAKADASDQYLVQTGLHDYRSTPGNRGVLVQRWVENDVVHFQIVTVWDGVAAIKQFAGQAYKLARYYPEDDH
jgi:hypothetical protein